MAAASAACCGVAFAEAAESPAAVEAASQANEAGSSIHQGQKCNQLATVED